jgi:hypothetical protein
MRQPLTVGDFRQLTEHLAANTPIITAAPSLSDHAYWHTSAVIDTALFDKGGTIHEYHGEAATPETETRERRKVVVVR